MRLRELLDVLDGSERVSLRTSIGREICRYNKADDISENYLEKEVALIHTELEKSDDETLTDWLKWDSILVISILL